MCCCTCLWDASISIVTYFSLHGMQFLCPSVAARRVLVIRRIWYDLEPAFKMWQKEDICRLYPPRHSGCLAKRYLVHCVDSTWHRCIISPHCVENCTVLSLLPLAFSSILASFSWFDPVFLAWHCAFLAPAFRCHREISTSLEAGTCAISRAWKFLFFRLPSSLWHPHTLAVISLRCVVTTLPWVFHAERNCTQTAVKEFFFKRH